MKNLIAKRLALPLALCGAVLPLSLAGCGGSNGTGPAKTQSTPAPTTGPVTPAPIALTPTTFTLANGQRVTLTGTRTGTVLSGTLRVLNAASQARLASGSQNAKFPFSVVVGEYPISGTFTPPRGFSIAGTFPTVGAFSLSGLLETQTEAGSYKFTAGGVTDEGIIPALNSNPTPTMTNTPVPPVPSTFQLTAVEPITITNSTSNKLITTTITSFVTDKDFTSGTFRKNQKIGSTGRTYETLSVGGLVDPIPANGTATYRSLGITVASDSFFGTGAATLSTGQTFAAETSNLNGVSLVQTTLKGFVQQSFNNWVSNSGTITLRALGTNSATIEFRNVHMIDSNNFGTPEFSEFTINGTVTASGLTVQNS